ncbi:hypothetical protein GCK72_004408 [Caenorhabditis remanei]|uniref:F-box domain-containing protein n=1 Tax=Caenorhabditis remanei TaxID=31234 RepID=A0A6A5H9G0_CAERE|nr:hypothetical protein GCK72_004408 [Caenorhabditis remanei]KAF1764460.1 hypothetical protein GCK72_004408 [Caenorhabditis remanei]
MPLLLEMPDLVMRRILEESDYVSIQSLRKSCHHLRNFIEDVKPESTMSKIDWSQTKKKVLENSDFLDVALRDIECILESKNSTVMDYIIVDWWQQDHQSAQKFLKGFRKILEQRTSLVRTRSFNMTSNTPDQTFQILPFMDADCLKQITIEHPDNDPKTDFKLAELMEFKQWKQAETLYLFNISLDIPVKNYIHFKKISVDIWDVSIDLVIELKEAFSTLSHLEHFEIHFHRCDAQNHLINKFGPPYQDENRAKEPRERWFFSIPGDPDIIHSIIFYKRVIIFNRFEKNRGKEEKDDEYNDIDTLPNNAIIL